MNRLLNKLNNLLSNKKYKSQFQNEEVNKISFILQDKISKKLENYKSLIIDIYYSIYKETNFDFADFMNRLQTNLNSVEINPKYDNSSYSSTYKTLNIYDKYFENPICDNYGNEILNKTDSEKLNNYNIVCALIHEGIHSIANNNFVHNKDIIESRYLDIYNELKTLQLEYKIYNKYFKELFKEGELINYSNKGILNYSSDNDRTYYAYENKLGFNGYDILNKMTLYIDFINENIDKCFLGKEDILKSSLNNEIYEDFSQKAMNFMKDLSKNFFYRIDNLCLYETMESFYRTIDYGIKEELIDKETYLKLKEQILSSESFVFKEIDTNKEFIKNGQIINFDIYFLNKIEEENYKKLKIDENINKENQYKVEEHFESIDFKPNINSLEANITIDRTL